MAEGNGNGIVNTESLGVGIRFASAIGNNKQMEMTAGIPLEWDIAAINAVLDKLAMAMDRQAARYMVIDMELDIKGEENLLNTNIAQRERAVAKWKSDFEASGRRGEWKPTVQQVNELKTWDSNIPHKEKIVAEKRIKLEAMKKLCL